MFLVCGASDIDHAHVTEVYDEHWVQGKSVDVVVGEVRGVVGIEHAEERLEWAERVGGAIGRSHDLRCYEYHI